MTTVLSSYTATIGLDPVLLATPFTLVGKIEAVLMLAFFSPSHFFGARKPRFMFKVDSNSGKETKVKSSVTRIKPSRRTHTHALRCHEKYYKQLTKARTTRPGPRPGRICWASVLSDYRFVAGFRIESDRFK